MTDRDLEGLRAIQDYVERHRYAISLRELMPVLGCAKTPAFMWVHRMRAAGLVGLVPHADRTVHLTALGLEAIGR